MGNILGDSSQTPLLVILGLIIAGLACFTGLRQVQVLIHTSHSAELSAIQDARFKLIEAQLADTQARLADVEQNLRIALQHVERCEEALAIMRQQR